MLHELKAKGKSIRAIARETGLSRNTVRKYLRTQGIPEGKPYPKRGSKLDPYKDTIQELMNFGIFNCEVIYERIKGRRLHRWTHYLEGLCKTIQASKKDLCRMSL
jgi:transposase